MSRSGRETLLDVRQALSDVRECSEGPHGCPGVVGRPSRMSGSGRAAIQMTRNVRETPLDVREACRMSGSGRKAIPDVREWLGGPLECPGVVGRLSR